MDEEEQRAKRKNESPDGRWKRSDEKSATIPVENASVAYDTDEGFMVQWNEIRFSTSRKKKDEERLVRKFDMLKQIQHENIAKFYDYWIDQPPGEGRRLVYITELMTSGTLKQYLKRQKKHEKPLGDNVWKRWCRQILSAVRYLHDCSPPIAHGNLKSNTIFIQHNGLIKIGAVCAHDIHQHVKTMTPNSKNIGWQYVPPELLARNSEEHVNATTKCLADIYAIGIIVIEMLSLEEAYCEVSQPSALLEAKHAGMVPAALAKLAPKNQQFVRSCLATSDKRATAHDLLFDPLLFEVPSLLKQTAARLVSQLDDDTDAYDEDERFQDACRDMCAVSHPATCTRTRDCLCYPAHIKTSKNRWLRPSDVNKGFKIDIEDREKFLEEVRLGFHPLIFTKGQRRKTTFPHTQPLDEPQLDPQAEVSETETRRLAHDCPPRVVATWSDDGTQCMFTVNLTLIDDSAEGDGRILHRQLDFSLPQTERAFAQTSSKLMVKHGLLHQDDRKAMVNAITKQLKKDPRAAQKGD
eukprot:m.38598 g.38598  ORF g.38598 m.38598 type:complete len:523 (+) comp11193_c0_seq1:104-1672(+)